MKKTKVMIIIIGLIIILSWSVRVYYVNKGIAKEYDIKTYQLDDTISFGNANFRITKMTLGTPKEENNQTYIPLSIEMDIENTSSSDISVIKLIESKLAYNQLYYQTNEGQFDTERLRTLPPNQKETLTLTYQIDTQHKQERPTLYIDQSLYRDLVLQEYQMGKRLGIAIKL